MHQHEGGMRALDLETKAQEYISAAPCFSSPSGQRSLLDGLLSTCTSTPHVPPPPGGPVAVVWCIGPPGLKGEQEASCWYGLALLLVFLLLCPLPWAPL